MADLVAGCPGARTGPELLARVGGFRGLRLAMRRMVPPDPQALNPLGPESQQEFLLGGIQHLTQLLSGRALSDPASESLFLSSPAFSS